MRREKIFVSSYACEPYKGSEVGVGWNWILQMSKQFELWVMTRANNQKPIEEYFKEHPEDNHGIHFVYFDLPDGIKRFKRKMKGIYFYYPMWTKCSYRLANRIMEENKISIYHQLTYGNALWGVNPIVKKKVFIWGPIGGLESLTPDFIKNFSLKSRVIETTRRIIAKGISLSPGFKFRCKNADLILCKTKSTFDSIPEKYRDKAVIFTDVAANIGGLEPINDNYSNAELTFVSAGRLDGWRGFDIMIEAFAHALETEKNMKLHIMGDGTEKKRLKALINKLGIEDSVLLLGNVSTERYREEIANSDVVLNTCLKEGGVTTAFDCMTYGKPLICLDTGGYTDNFDDTCADIIPVNSREGTIKAIANSILSMRDSDKRRRYSYSMRQKGTQSDWEHKGVMINQMFMELISPPSNTLDLSTIEGDI